MRRAIGFLLVGLTMTGCGSSGSGADEGGPGDPNDPLAETGMLRPVRNAAELESTLRAALGTAVVGLPDGPVAVTPMTGTAEDFSGTYTAEAGVDELDTARYDGQYLYVSTWSAGVSAAPEIRILRTDPATATATPVGLIALDSSQYVQGMYLEDGRLLIVTTENYMGTWGDAWPAVIAWAPSRFTVQVHDVRDPAHPQRLMTATLDGGFVASRRIDDRVVLVSRHSPRALLDPQQRRRLQSLSLAELLPSIMINGGKESLVDPRHCYIDNDGGGHGHAVITSITTFSLSNPSGFATTCYDEPTTGVYASRAALYIAEPVHAAGSAEKTRIHKFALGGERARYAGSAEVPGAAWSGGQADFRMSESGDLLRVVTTEFTDDATDWFDYRLFVLRPKANQRALEIVGRLPSDARPEEIGKPNEALFGVRFDGDRAYAVTFRRIDPLYVIDLSSPADPRIAGHLELPGVSEFLHPVSRDLLLGLGTDSGRLKLELFDTTVLEHPQSRGAISVGESWSSSPALYERHAFTYLAGENTDRLAVPAVIGTLSNGVIAGWSNELRQFEIQGKQTPASAALLETGAVAPPAADEYGYSPERAFLSGDSVYYVREGKVWGSFWATPSQVNGPY